MMPNSKAQTIFVADSDRTVLELLQIRLDVAGYHACVARTGNAVLDMLRHTRPAAMIIDTKLAEVDGFEVLRILQQKNLTPPLPILVMGRALTAEDIQRALRLGARDCMSKPFAGADVLDRVGRLLRRPSPSAAPQAAHAYI